MATHLRALLLFLIPLGLACVPKPGHAGSPIKSDEEVVLFSSAAHRDGNTWVAPIHGWIFEPEDDSMWRGALIGSLRRILRVSQAQEPFFRKRAAWFAVDNERGKKISVNIGGVSQLLARSGSDGHCKGSVRLPGTHSGMSLPVYAHTRKGDSRRFEGRVFLIPEEGVSVISDIDDTIKITDARDHRRTLERTFLEPFLEVPEMATVYRGWAKEGAVFHYVSAGPWHLFVPLSNWLRQMTFPLGTLHLRTFRLKDKSRWNLLESPMGFKTKIITDLLARFPRRRFVLVGDSGQEDPEIYAAIARAHPAQIQAIYIRLVAPGDMNTERRRAVAFGHKVPLTIFTSPGLLTL